MLFTPSTWFRNLIAPYLKVIKNYIDSRANLIPGERRSIPVAQTIPSNWIAASPIAPTLVSLDTYPNLTVFPHDAPIEKLDMENLVGSGEVTITQSAYFLDGVNRIGAKLFDGGIEANSFSGGEWTAPPDRTYDYVDIDFGVGSQVKIIKAVYVQRTHPDYNADNVELLHSNDGINWVSLGAVTLITAAGYRNEVEYAGSAQEARYYRIAINHTTYASLGEVEFYVSGVSDENNVVIPAIPVSTGFKTIIWGG